MVDFDKIKDNGVFAQVSKKARAMPSVNAGIGFFGEFYLKPIDGEAAAQVGVDILSKDPAKLEKIAATAQVKHTETMRKEVATGLSKVYEQTTPEYVEQIATGLIPNKNYIVLNTAIETDKNVGGTLSAVNGNPAILTDIIAISSADAVKDAATKDRTRRRTAELTKGKVIDSTGQVDMKNGSLYCVKEVNKLPANRQAAYHEGAGFTYTAIKEPTHFREQ